MVWGLILFQALFLLWWTGPRSELGCLMQPQLSLIQEHWPLSPSLKELLDWPVAAGQVEPRRRS